MHEAEAGLGAGGRIYTIALRFFSAVLPVAGICRVQSQRMSSLHLPCWARSLPDHHGALSVPLAVQVRFPEELMRAVTVGRPIPVVQRELGIDHAQQQLEPVHDLAVPGEERRTAMHVRAGDVGRLVRVLLEQISARRALRASCL